VGVRTLIVDDEHLARKGLRLLLEAEPDIEIVGEAANGAEAVDLIRDLGPELVFLDIQMPEADGFQVLEAVGPLRGMVVVFVTAFDEFALQAFEARALDYLLKPVDADRFAQTLDRARQQVRQHRAGEIDDRLRHFLEDVHGKRGFPERIALKVGPRTRFVRIADIDWMEAEGNYIRLHVGDRSHLVRETMAMMEDRLDPTQFVRIHRSTFVNVDRIRELETVSRSESVVILNNGRKLTASRGYRERLRAVLGEH
jgi:two-component system, LytTR family, response regulator